MALANVQAGDQAQDLQRRFADAMGALLAGRVIGQHHRHAVENRCAVRPSSCSSRSHSKMSHVPILQIVVASSCRSSNSGASSFSVSVQLVLVPTIGIAGRGIAGQLGDVAAVILRPPHRIRRC